MPDTDIYSADPTLVADLTTHIEQGDIDTFDALARRVFAHQYRHNRPYRTFCDGRGVTLDSLTSWRDIPPAPAGTFKRFALTCAPEADCTPERGGRVFHSSGTTQAETSRHFMDAEALELYRRSLWRSFRHFVLPDNARLYTFALMSPPQEAPNSSLSFMLGEILEQEEGAFYVGADWQKRAQTDLAARNGPAIVFGTAFALVHLLDGMVERGETLQLPPGSRVVETGGFKGRSREVSRDELYALFTDRLGVPPSHCLSEYGMSEMASQFYDTTLLDHVQGIDRPSRKTSLPHLLRTRVFDPVTGQEASPGEPGLLAHYDLCNLNSVLAIQTEDYGYATPDGDGFILLGRAPGAILRGCSLTAEEMMG